jgi:nicotinate (nicotinamide) nucleotide adenylyltransferase
MAKKHIIGMFGGTFDPPHLGHTGLAREILRAGAADELVFVPASVPPHKPARPSASFADRIRMLEIAIEGAAGFSISDIEGRREGPSYTFDTLVRFSDIYSGADIRLVIGSDSLETLHEWCKGREIPRKWDLLVYPRPGHILSEARLLENWDAEASRKLMASLLPVKAVFDIASTEIRYRIKIGKSLHGLVASGVERYIMDKGIYAP